MNDTDPVLESLRHLQTQMSRIETKQATLSNSIDMLRADLVIVASRQNSKIEDAKKKQIGRRPLSKHWLGV